VGDAVVDDDPDELAQPRLVAGGRRGTEHAGVRLRLRVA
jgi:hypothetical protein